MKFMNTKECQDKQKIMRDSREREEKVFFYKETKIRLTLNFEQQHWTKQDIK